jgi:23S rRNA (uracil1939-C5)-methyltransferase
MGMEDPFHYRNKVHAVFTHRRNGSVLSGIYEEGTHTVVPVEECLLENKKADEIIGSIRELLKSFKIKTYDEDTGYGLFRHALIRTAHQTGQIMVVLVLASPILPSKNNFVKALRALHPEITTIVLNVNDKKTSMVLGDRETILYGKGYIEDVLCGCRFRISAKSFYQINSVQTERLYGKAMELAGLTGKERVIDAYCGIGTIGLVASKHAGEVIGVELNPDAVRDAVRNAKANEARNVQFYQNDAGKFMVQMAQEGEKADVVFMDPPRSGSDEAFLSSVVSLSPKRIVYISCNPETQARDLQYLTRHGYRAEGIWPYDMFPFTNHVETICCLSRIK